MIDSGSVGNIITKTLVNNIRKTIPSARCIARECERLQNIFKQTDLDLRQICNHNCLQ